MPTPRKKKKIIQPVPRGRITIQSTFNNLIISIADQKGSVLSWASAGSSGFKGGRKATPYAAQVTMRNALEKARPYTIGSVDIFVSGAGSGRDASIRALQGTGINVTSIQDVTPIPHNGVRAKKPRRV